MRGHKATRQERTLEVSKFLGVPYYDASVRLSEGFLYNHAKVAEDFRRVNPQTDDELLAWYRETDAYVWELTAYHLDPGYNYTGMVEGIAKHLSRDISELNAVIPKKVLCLGDGIGDLTFCLKEYGHEPVYHDLAASRTSKFALHRMSNYAWCMSLCTGDWAPPRSVNGLRFDAIIALDFMEHLPNVEEWAKFVADALNPVTGLFLAQNAFGIGDPDHEGSIPMHLARNNRFVTDWDPLLERLGLENQRNGWWRKP